MRNFSGPQLLMIGHGTNSNLVCFKLQNCVTVILLCRELRDSKYLQQKLTTKEARTLYENSVRIEHEFRSEFSGKRK